MSEEIVYTGTFNKAILSRRMSCNMLQKPLINTYASII